MTQPQPDLSPAIRANLRRTAAAQLQWPDAPVTVTPLAGDASNRRYFRIASSQPPSQPHNASATAIVMLLADPEGFKASEEAVGSSAPPVTELPFLNIWRHLNGRGLHVPRIHHYDQAGGWLLIEDTGDRLLSHAVHGQPPEAIRTLYRQAIEELVKLQTLATTPPDPRCLAFGRSFDEALLMWEFDHFVEYGIEARQGVALTPAQRRSIDAAFRPIAAELAAQPRCFTHRDYHSRNLMLHRDRIWLIDFQDALLGPPHYDLASLLRDSYITLSDDLIDGLIGDYVRLSEQAGRRIADPAAFRRLFDLTSVQRNLKAAGRFVYIDRVKKNPNFLPSIPRTLANVRANCRRYPELKPLADLLAPLVPELSAGLSGTTP
ncbi:MAG: phosphotransferase [Nitrospirae bacterium]|nr:phosphotransferase [Nitrospirota bacterium]